MDLCRILVVLCMAALGYSETIGTLKYSGNEHQVQKLSVMDFGAVGDGTVDDSQAFMKAWKTVCETTSDSVTLLVPGGKKFLLKPVKFHGECKSRSIHFEIQGTIIAPSEMSDWTTYSFGSWIAFYRVDGLTVDGNGLIDGQGANWWKCVKENHCTRPMALKFAYCNSLQLNGITLLNSPSKFISVSDCHNSLFSNLNISAPEDSPNTDGIDITHSKNVTVRDTTIHSGDDCIAILPGCSNINITGLSCIYTHGISMGSMGHNGDHAEMEGIHVKNCSFDSSTNGAHIKTWQGGSGFARKITFEDINVTKTQNPIFIDQFYCPGMKCSNQTSAVEISDISFINIRGTTSTKNSIAILCSDSVDCTNIVLDNINIKPASPGTQIPAVCNNAHGTASNTSPPVDCLRP